MNAIHTRIVLPITLAIWAAACASGPAPVDLAPDTGPVTLMPGDSVRISVWRYAEYSGTFGIAPDGTIAHPVYRAVRASRIPISDMEPAIRDALRPYLEDPSVVVEPLLVVAVMGDVNLPGTYALPPATTLAQAVARAGGPALTAKRGSAKLLRLEESRGILELGIDLNDPSDAAFRQTIRSGDQIVVPQKTFTTALWISLIAALAAVGLVIERIAN